MSGADLAAMNRTGRTTFQYVYMYINFSQARLAILPRYSVLCSVDIGLPLLSFARSQKILADSQFGVFDVCATISPGQQGSSSWFSMLSTDLAKGSSSAKALLDSTESTMLGSGPQHSKIRHGGCPRNTDNEGVPREEHSFGCWCSQTVCGSIAYPSYDCSIHHNVIECWQACVRYPTTIPDPKICPG